MDYEISQTPDPERKRRLNSLLNYAHQVVPLSEEVLKRGEEIRQFGFRSYNALHIAVAEAAKVDVFLSTDDKLVRLASRHAQGIRVTVGNPLQWLQKETQHA